MQIDKFAFKHNQNPETCIYVLTHAHTDHSAGLSLKFPYVIHCSRETKILMSHLYPQVTFKDDLIPGVWSVVDDKLLIFCFDSNHCVGSIGVYCPDLGLLHFGDGRPSKQVHSEIQEFNAQLEGKVLLTNISCDPFVKEALVRFKSPFKGKFKMPTQKESTQILGSFLARQNKKVCIQVAHFGALSCIPRNLGYQWVEHEKNTSRAVTLCKAAFDLLCFQHGEIEVCCTWDKKKNGQQQSDREVNVILSATWFFQNCFGSETKPPNLFEPMIDKDENVRIFACGHASPFELETNYQGMCN